MLHYVIRVFVLILLFIICGDFIRKLKKIGIGCNQMVNGRILMSNVEFEHQTEIIQPEKCRAFGSKGNQSQQFNFIFFLCQYNWIFR